MKRTSYFLALLAVVLMASSCSNKPKTREQQVEDFRNSLTEEDSTTMLSLCDNAMEQLKNKKIQDVLSMLFEYDDSTKQATPLSEKTAKRLERRFTMFPVLDYNRQYYSFMLEGCNDVKYEVTFATAEQAGTDKPATTMFMFNPVKIDGEWKLCVKTAKDEIDMGKQ